MGSGYLYIDGTANSQPTTPDSAAVSVAGDIDMRVRVALDDWTPAGIMSLGSKFTSDPNRSYRLYVNTSGTLLFQTTPDGTYASRVTATSTAATGLSDGAERWVRVTRDVDNGAAGNTTRFYLSTDGSSWTQLGSDVVVAGVTSISDGNETLLIGGSGGSLVMAGNLYAFQLYSGIGGTLAFDADFTDLTSSEVAAASFVEDSANAATVTLPGAAWMYVFGRKHTKVAGPGQVLLTGG